MNMKKLVPYFITLLMITFASLSYAGDIGKGAEIYNRKCVICHGPYGKGDGNASKNLNPKPADFTSSKFSSGKSDSQIINSITKGIGSMPGYGKILKTSEIENVAAYIRSLSGKRWFESSTFKF